MIPAFPKIFSLGQKYTTDIFNDPVEITEKIDGSQFSFGKVDGLLEFRSKNCRLMPDENCHKMFRLGVDWVQAIRDKLKDNVIYYGEYLNKPKHNAIVYDRVPLNNFILFGVCILPDRFITDYDELKTQALMLGCEVVPLLSQGIISPTKEYLDELLTTRSILGDVSIEGFVVKNYTKGVIVNSSYVFPIMMGKYVSESFKELNSKAWTNSKTSTIMALIDKYKTEARWDKAIQHLRDDGKLEESPKDIGLIINEVIRDIEEEELDNIKDELYKLNRKCLTTGFIRGLPEWYKQKLFVNNTAL